VGLTVVYLETAASGLRRLRETDKGAFRHVIRAVKALASDPYPDGAIPWGSSGLYRLHAGKLRVLYEVDEKAQAVRIIDVSMVS
jgi:mRNA interferase RelE/StbE